MSDCCGCQMEADTREQRRVLRWLLAINAVMFVAELTAGLVADSTALVADSLDMFADAAVYTVSLLAVAASAARKARAARLSGLLQVALALFALAEVIRRAVQGSDPEPAYMLAVGAVALAANVTCLKLISRYREGEVHLRAAFIFSANDVIANLGVVAGGALVLLLGTHVPDLVIGAIVAVVVLRGGLRILREAAAG